MKQLQFELWQECGSNCKFCYLGDGNKFTNNELKMKSLQNTIDKISDLSLYSEYDTLSYLGGEFFQGQLRTPELKEKFLELMEKTAWLKDNGYIKQVWIYATMTIGDQKDLYDSLEKFKNKDGLWILSSYDTMGRFHTPKMEETWKYHMKHIHELYPEVKFNVTTIITGDLIEKYLNDELSFKKMMEEYHTEFFFKQCGLGAFESPQKMNEKIGNFFPKRDSFIKFLIKFRKEESPLIWDKLFNIKYRADSLYRNFNDDGKQMILNKRFKDRKNEVETENANDMLTGPCGHLKLYQAYIDSDKCVVCDKQMVESLYK